MKGFPLTQEPHRRYDPLGDSWVLVSPHRTRRPWHGQLEQVPEAQRPPYDPRCYLCPGNRRAGGRRNPRYRPTFAFDNDFAALRIGARGGARELSNLLRVAPERGICRVLCFSPRHDLSLAQMSVHQILQVIDAWIQEYRALSRRRYVSHVQIFENKGEMMGCSNPHPHGQIWAQESVPQKISQELACQSGYLDRTGGCLLCDYLSLEFRLKERIVCANDGFVALVPFWAVWPFETLLVSNDHHASLAELGPGMLGKLAALLLELTVRYDNLFRISFPYSMGWHQAPIEGARSPGVHLHAHFYPPLLRSAAVRKFMVGYELLAEPQRDITAEASADQLRRQPAQRFT